jgi:hypothetical protein
MKLEEFPNELPGLRIGILIRPSATPEDYARAFSLTVGKNEAVKWPDWRSLRPDLFAAEMERILRDDEEEHVISEGGSRVRSLKKFVEFNRKSSSLAVYLYNSALIYRITIF